MMYFIILTKSTSNLKKEEGEGKREEEKEKRKKRGKKAKGFIGGGIPVCNYTGEDRNKTNAELPLSFL